PPEAGASRPAPSARAPASAATRSATRAISSGSGRRPGPVSAPVRRPAAGSITCTPRARSVATFATVAGCSHISVCIAGAMTTGQRAVSRVEVSRSSARPDAARASRSAVAGATTTRSAPWPSATCGTCSTSSNTWSVAGSPDSASHVGAPTKRSAAAVGTTRTRCPCSRSSRSSSTALYAATPPLTPSTIRMSLLRLVWPPAVRERGASARGRTNAAPSGGGARRAGSGLGGLFGLGLDGQQARVDLAHRDRQRLFLVARLEQRADVLEQALAELRVVRVDLARALRRVDDERVLRVDVLEQVVDRRVGDALGGGD